MPKNGMHILDEIVIRFAMPDADAKYHIPIIMSPNSYSCWWSS
jgi:5-hydroxyisourate hydrolase